MQAKDIMKTSLDGDLLIQGGDFASGLSDTAHVFDILNDYPGFWKQFPVVGVGLPSYENGNINNSFLSSLIISQLQNDGYTVNKPKISLNPSTSELVVVPSAYRK